MISFARNEQRKKQEGNGPIDQRATGAMTYGAVELKHMASELNSVLVISYTFVSMLLWLLCQKF